MVGEASVPLFVGRDRELAVVVEALADPPDSPALVLVEGEAGIGKTRLLREALASRSVCGRTVLVAACPPLDEPFSLGAVVAGLRRLRPQLAGLGLSSLGGALRPLFPEWADQLPPALEALEDATQTRHRLFGALSELVERLGVEILVVEDAHWADGATLEWLLTLAAGGLGEGAGGLSVVVSYRPADVAEGSPLLRLTSRAAGQVRVRLGPLDVQQSRQLVGSMLGAEEVSDKFAGFLYARTDGVPLAVEETVRLLRERDDITRGDGGWARRVLEELEVPPTVRDSVLERVARLPVEARGVLEAAAVLTEAGDEATLVAVAGLGDDAARVGVSAALGCGLLQETDPGRFGFRHVLDAQAVGEAISGSRRRWLHQRAAEVLREVDPLPVVRLARHFREGGDIEWWCHYAEAAADLALEAGDDHTTVTVLHELLTTVEHPGQRRARLARKLGEAAFVGAAAIGEVVQQVVRTLRRVLACADVPANARGELRLLLGRLLWRTPERAAAFEEIEAAIPDLGHRPDLAIRAMTNLAMPLVPEWTAARHLSWLERAGQLAGQVPSLDRLVLARARADVLLLLGQEAGWSAVAELPVAASDPQEQRRLASGWLNVAWATLAWGRYEESRRVVDLAVRHIQQAGYRRRLGSARLAESYLDWYVGRWHGLDRAVAELATLGGDGPVDDVEVRQLSGLLELVRGVRASAERNLQVVVDERNRLGLVDPVTILAPAGLARLLLADDEPSKALPVTEPVMAMIVQKQVWLWATDIAPVHVEALVAVGRLVEAQELVGQFAAGLAGREAPAPAVALVVCWGIVAEAGGDLAAAVEWYAEAASAWAVLPRPYDELLVRERQGRCLLAAGRQGEALEVLAGVQRGLQELGARWDADRVAQLLRQHGVEVTRAWRGGRRGYGNQLSPRELDVVRMVARGMTSRETAGALFLSPRTVDGHRSSAMRKLGVNSRAALAAAADDAGLLGPETDRQATRG